MRMRVGGPNGTPHHDILPSIHSHESRSLPPGGLNGSPNDTLHPLGRNGRVPVAYRARDTPAPHTPQGNCPGRYIPVPTTTGTGCLERGIRELRSSPQGGNRGTNCKPISLLPGRGDRGRKACEPQRPYQHRGSKGFLPERGFSCN